KNSEPNGIYGVLPYIAPEVLIKEQYTKASDIYSFGMIMLEIFTGRRPYHDTSHDEDLAIKICLGSKPEIKCEIPQFLALINKCLDEAQDRPTAKELVGILKKCLLDLNDEKTKLYKQVEAIKNSAINSSIDYQTHEQAIYTGRRLYFPKLYNS
ncbi:kinase-like domain-containing protein, partial [Gigaspora rosea]